MAASIIDLTEENSPAVDRPTPAPEHRLHRLQHALAVAQPERLRQTLLDLCSKCPDIAEKASALLLVAEDEAVSIHESDEESNRSDVEDGGTDSEASVTEPSSAIADEAPLVQASNGNKRLRPRYAVCINCDEEFDVTCNEKGDCTWHNGECEPDYDADIWTDHDENCHGTIDDDGMRESYPEGFVWDCCDEDNTHPGCRRGKHEEENSIKRVRYS